jgi:hypothetical protein
MMRARRTPKVTRTDSPTAETGRESVAGTASLFVCPGCKYSTPHANEMADHAKKCRKAPRPAGAVNFCIMGCGYPVAYAGDPCGECACEDDGAIW